MFNSPIPASEDPCLELSYPGSRRRQSGVWRSLPRAFPRLEKEAKRGFLSFFLSIGLLYDVNNVLHSVALRPCMCSCLTHVCCQMSNGHPEPGMWLSDVLFNPKYAGHIYKVTVAVDNLGNIVWICDLMPGTSADVMIWDQRGPSRTHGQFFDFEIGAHDGASKGRLHTAVPYIGRKTLTDDQQEYNDVHGFYRARVEHLFARLWQWRIVRNVWTRSATELHGHVRILLHLTQFCIRRQTRYQPYGPWPHVPESVWAQEEATVVEEENDDGVCCQLCGHRPGDISECGTCHLNMCASCMPLHSCTL